MRRTHFARTSLALLTGVAAVLWLATPASAAPQRGRSGGGRPTSSRPAPSGGGQPASAPRAVPRDTGRTGSGDSTPSSGTASTPGRPTSSHSPTSGATVGRATAPVPGSGTGVVVPNGYYGGFYPWGWAGLGFGGYYAGYYGYYDPWIDDGGGYYGQPYTTSGYDDGLLRLKVKPRDGMVYVDGFFAGVVDDFDGIFQHLHIEPGAHHIEIMADGYEPLEINVQIRRGRTVTYSGDLKKIQ